MLVKMLEGHQWHVMSPSRMRMVEWDVWVVFEDGGWYVCRKVPKVGMRMYASRSEAVRVAVAAVETAIETVARRHGQW
jgi:hypothetical protein